MLKVKLQYFVLLMWRVHSLEKTLMLAKTEGNRRRQRQRMRWLDSIADSMDVNLSKLREMMEDRGERYVAVNGVEKSQARFGDWTTKTTTQDRSGYEKLSWSWLLLFSRSVVSDSTTPGTAARQASLSFTLAQSLLKLMSIESVMPSNQLIFCCPLLLPPSIFPSIRVFPNESALHNRPKYSSFSFSISPFNEHSGLISFRMDWLDLLTVQGILKSPFQHHSSKASILWHSVFFMV